MRRFASAIVVLGVIVCSLIAGLLAGGSANAAAFTVTKTADTNDGFCTPADCSLREAIIAANTAPGPDTISLPPGTYLLTIVGTNEDAGETGDLDILDSLTITGAGASLVTVDGGGADRVVDIRPGAAALIAGVEISNGNTLSSGGGIDNNGSLTLDRTIISNNIADDDGGGIDNSGALLIRDSTVSANGAGVAGGIRNRGSLTLERSTLSGNSAVAKGGLLNADGATATVTNTTISGNSIQGFGFDIAAGIDNAGTLTLHSSTVTGNSGGVGVALTGNMSVKNTIVEGNGPPGDCDANTPNLVTSEGHNLSGDDTCFFDSAGDLENSDPMLAPLADNGGPTMTHALVNGSPAIDAGSVDCPPPASDQRGALRPAGATCDIGAFEAGGVIPSVTAAPSPTVTPPSTPTPTPGLSQTFLAAFVPAGAVAIEVDSTVGFEAGDFVIISPEEIVAETARIKALAGLSVNQAGAAATIELEEPLLFDHPAGDLVVEITAMPVKWGDVLCAGDVGSTAALAVLVVLANLAALPHPDCPAINDGVTVQQANAQVGPLGGGAQKWGDVNCSGTADSIDALQILLFVAHLPVPAPPVGCPGIGEAVTLLTDN